MADAPLEFDNPKDLEDWLRDKPAEWAQAIAVRAALRVWPSVVSLLDPKGYSLDAQVAFLIITRTAFASWVATFYPACVPGKFLEIGFVVPGISEKSAAAAAFAAADAAADAAAATDHVPAFDAARAVFQAANADFAADSVSIWDAATADVCWLVEHENGNALVRQPLWAGVSLNPESKSSNPRQATAPGWVFEMLERLETSELVQNGDWGLWLDWYRSILPADPNTAPKSAFGEAADLEIATQPAEFWELDDPDAVMEGIAEIVRRHAPPSNEPEIGAQEGGFVFAAQGRKLAHIPASPDADEADDSTQAKIFVRLKRRLERLQQSLQNSAARYPALADALDDYSEAVSAEKIADLEIDELWLSGVGLISQARAFAALDETRHVTEPLEPEQQALLGEIARLHGAFVMGFEAGRRLAERSQVPLLTPEEFRILLEHERAIVRWLLESDEYALSDSVRSVFQTLDHVLVSTSENAETLATTGYPVLRNLLIFTAHGLRYVKGLAGDASLGGVPVHLAVQGMAAFLLNNLGDILGFAGSVPELRAYFEYHLTRLEIDYRERRGKDDR